MRQLLTRREAEIDRLAAAGDVNAALGAWMLAAALEESLEAARRSRALLLREIMAEAAPR